MEGIMLTEAMFRQVLEDLASMRNRIAQLERIENRVDSASVTDATASATANTVVKRDSVAATGLNGVSFPASMVSNAGVNVLDDYEEGTWTPALDSESGQVGSFTYSAQLGYYTKIGRISHAMFSLVWTAKPSAGNVVRIGGLPFSADISVVTGGYFGTISGVTFTERGGGTTGTMLAIANYNSTYATPIVQGSGLVTTDARINMAQLGTSGVLRGGIFVYSAT